MEKNTGPVVETAGGKVSGVYEKGVYTFRGIPYAAPPVGERRWLPPDKRKTWSGVLEAVSFGPVSPQNPGELSGLKIPGLEITGPQSEDCLYLNIWTTGLGKGSRPVMVWIHGGAFILGSGSQTMFRGDTLASRGDVVVVTINYRLGLLGFLNLNEVTKGKIPATGNEGFLDQIAALQWVKDNIQDFGGDPDNVTVFGNSAGGTSVCCLMTVPKARGLLRKAIMESGMSSLVRPLTAAVEMSERFLEGVGLKSDAVKELRSLPVEGILAVQKELTLKAPDGVTPVTPVIDGKIIAKKPLEALRSGSAKDIPFIAGSTQEEWKIFALGHPESMVTDEAGLLGILKSAALAGDIPRLIDTYKKARAARGETTSPFELFSAIQTDVLFRIPALRAVEAQCRQGRAAFNYIFNWKSPAMGGALGAGHGLEIGFVFGTCDNVFCGVGPQVKQLAIKIQDAWLAFARTGNPSTKSLGDWPSYCDNRKTMLLGKECQVKEAPYEEERLAWENLGDAGPA